MKTKIIINGLLFLLPLAIFAKQPKWIKKTPMPSNNTFYYVVGKGYGNTYDVANEKASQDAMKTIAENLGMEQKVSLSSSSELNSSRYPESTVKNKNEFNSKQANQLSKKKIQTYDVKLKGGEYCVYVLYQVASAGNISPIYDFKINYK